MKSETQDPHLTTTGGWRLERIQVPEALRTEVLGPGTGTGPPVVPDPEGIRRSPALQGLLAQGHWIYLPAEVIGSDHLVGYFNPPDVHEVVDLAYLVLEVAPRFGARPRLRLEAGSASVTFGEDDSLNEVDLVFASLFNVALPHVHYTCGKEL